jgi:hypothetical protein
LTLPLQPPVKLKPEIEKLDIKYQKDDPFEFNSKAADQ